MSTPMHRLFSALARLAASEIHSGEFLPSGRKTRQLYGESCSVMERKGTHAVEQRKPDLPFIRDALPD
jgi:hypothetical protein